MLALIMLVPFRILIIKISDIAHTKNKTASII
jgi:hypothetical protein